MTWDVTEDYKIMNCVIRANARMGQIIKLEG